MQPLPSQPWLLVLLQDSPQVSLWHSRMPLANRHHDQSSCEGNDRVLIFRHQDFGCD
jgi:hypothetical protein